MSKISMFHTRGSVGFFFLFCIINYLNLFGITLNSPSLFGYRIGGCISVLFESPAALAYFDCEENTWKFVGIVLRSLFPWEIVLSPGFVRSYVEQVIFIMNETRATEM